MVKTPEVQAFLPFFLLFLPDVSLQKISQVFQTVFVKMLKIGVDPADQPGAFYPGVEEFGRSYLEKIADVEKTFHGGHRFAVLDIIYIPDVLPDRKAHFPG